MSPSNDQYHSSELELEQQQQQQQQIQIMQDDVFADNDAAVEAQECPAQEEQSSSSGNNKCRKRALVLGATCIALASAVIAATIALSPNNNSASAAVAPLRRRLRSMYYAFDADEEEDRDDLVHIVYASDFHSIAGVEASIRSVQAHASAPHRVQFYFIGDDPLPTLPEVQYINLTEAAIKYNVDEFTNPNYERKGKHQREEGVKINTNAANYVRFVMDKLLPDEAKKVFWIDSDTIVRCDVVQLVENSLVNSEYVIAAVPVPGPPLGIFPDHRPDYADIKWTFNAGVYMVDLEKWRKQDLTETMRAFAQKNREEVIYKFGSQPPLTLTFKEDFEHLPKNWNVKLGKSSEEEVEDACLLHWAGADKPWNSAGEHIEIWHAYDAIDESVEEMD